jgi:transcriptional regulator with XRE-family HTH domain
MENLTRLRELKGFSQRALAKESGVSPATIHELENGRRRANPSTLRKLAAALDVEVADLLGAEYPKGERRSSHEPSFEDALAEERREAIYQPWADFVNRYVDRWEARIAAGDFDLASIEEFARVSEDFMATLGPLGRQERHEQPTGYPYSYGPITGEAIGRLMDLLNPMLAAAAEKFPGEVLGDELEPLRRKRDERLRELRRGA